MIRPVTCVCFLLACGSGLYVYQSKHRVQLLDRDIEKTVRATDALREQTRAAHAEWTLLNDPQRLQILADQFLNLKNVAPGQFTSLAELDNRLPAVSVPEPAPQEPLEAPVPEPPPPVAVVPPPAPAKPAVVAVAPPRVPEHRLLRRTRCSPRCLQRARLRRYFARSLQLTCRGRQRRGSFTHPCPRRLRPGRSSVPRSAWRGVAGRCHRRNRCR